MMLTILVSGPKQPGDRIYVYLKALVDDLKILWKPGVKEVWDEFMHEEFIMRVMLFTTINDNTAHHNLSGYNKKERCSLPTLVGRHLHYVAKTFKEIRIYGAPSFSQQEISIPGHALSV
jgi:hypothetical protein